jgi:hypothetical protein
MAAPAFADDLVGQASIIDGDTLEIHDTRIRLWGIDAPKSSQLCRVADSLQHLAAARMSKNKLSRDFRSVSIFDFCNNICHPLHSFDHLVGADKQRWWQVRETLPFSN